MAISLKCGLWVSLLFFCDLYKYLYRVKVIVLDLSPPVVNETHYMVRVVNGIPYNATVDLKLKTKYV